MIVELLFVFTSGGGMPPANSTFLEVYRDGRAVLLVGNSLAEGKSQDEAGLYQMALSASEEKSIEDFISANKMFDLSEEYGPVRSDSGFYELHLYTHDKQRKIRWGPFARAPKSIREMETLISELVQSIRRHPVQVIGATLRIADQVTVGHKFYVEFSIKNRGSEPVQVLIPTERNAKSPVFKLHAVASERATSDAPLFLNLYQQAQHISTVKSGGPSARKSSIKLSPGVEIKTRALAPFSIDTPGRYKLYGFVEPVLKVMANGKPITVDCFVATRPITIDVH